MKNVILSTCLLFLATVTSNFTNAQVELSKGAKIKFNKNIHDYGQVKYDGDGTCTFEFTNEGNEDLVISNAKGSCGCTVPDYPKEPIAPGKSGIISVKYDTKRSGVISKSVTITSNAINHPSGTIVLQIKGEVLPAPVSGAPVNNSGAPTNN
ncbi:MAG: DUF1573 domain-containing protein [Bacteroidota bacterium]